MRTRRSLLYVPGSDLHKIEKAASLQVDSVCLDLEDGVAFEKKSEARGIVARALESIRFKGERLARINAVGTGLEQDDLSAVLPSRPDGIIVPKITNSKQVHWVSDQIAAVERQKRWASGSVRLLLMIESARAIVNLADIAGADRRIDALIFGAEDLAADIGATRTLEGQEVAYARSALVLAAAAFEIQAIDLLDTDFTNFSRLREEASQGARLGFSGKQIIHPSQIEPVEQAFSPSDEEISNARRVIDASARAQAEGAGAFALDGKMVDRPIVRAAERVLERARAAGKV